MKLGDFLSNSSLPAPTKQVRFRVAGVNPGTGERRIADADALLVFVSEHERQEVNRDAQRAIRDIYGADPVPPERLSDEVAIQLLRRALRDIDDVRAPFAESARDLRNALNTATLRQLVEAYWRFIEEEFPSAITEEEQRALVEEAKKS